MVPPAPSVLPPSRPVPSSSPTNYFPPFGTSSPSSCISSFSSSTTSSFFRHTLFRIIAHVHVFRSNTRVFHFTWTLIVHLCAHWREEEWGGGWGKRERRRQQTWDQKMRVQK